MDDSREERLSRLTHLLCSKSQQIVDSAKREITKLISKDHIFNQLVINKIDNWRKSSIWEERIVSSIILQLVLDNTDKSWCSSIIWKKDSIPVNQMDATYIRSCQQWLTSDRSVDFLDKEMSLKQIQKRLKTVIHEEMEEGKDDTEQMLDNVESLLHSNPIASLVTENDITKKQTKEISSNQQKDNWVQKMIQEEFQVSSSPLTNLFLDCLKDCINVAWETRHGACELLSIFIQSSSFHTSIHHFLFYLLLIVLFSDYFLDASTSTIILPVHESIIHCLSTLLQQDPSLINLSHSFLSTLLQYPSFRPAEQWIWYYNIACLLNLLQSATQQEEEAINQWFSQNDYLTQLKIMSFLSESTYHASPSFLEKVELCILQNLSSIDYMSEWCCCLDQYFNFLPPKQGYASNQFSTILTYYLSILFPSSSIQLSTQSDHCFLLYLCIFSHYSVQAVRKAVYSCIERILPIIDWQQDPSAFYSIILLLDAVIRETDLQPESIHCFLLLLSSLSTQPQSYLSSLQQSIHHHLNQTPSCLAFQSSQSITPFTTTSDSYWCFFRDSKTIHYDILFCCYSWICACCQSFSLLHNRDYFLFVLLQDETVFRKVMKWYKVTIPSCNCFKPLNLERMNLNDYHNEDIRYNHQLQLVIDSINQLVSKYSILQFWKSDDLLIKSKEEIEEIIDKENDKYSKEDDLIYFVLLKKKVMSYYELKEELDKKVQQQQQIDLYFNQLIQYKLKPEKKLLITLLSQFHHILPFISFNETSLLGIVLCTAIDIQSSTIFQRIIKNVCRLSLQENCIECLSILFTTIQDTEIIKTGEEQLKELILLGVNGNEDDIKKSLDLIHILHASETTLSFLLQVFDRLVNQLSIQSTNSFLQQFSTILSSFHTDYLHKTCFHSLESIMNASEQQVFNQITFFIECTKQDSLFFLSFHYHLLNLLLNVLSQYNSNPIIHSLLLHFYSILLPFVGLDPVFSSHCWLEEVFQQKQEEREKERKQYEEQTHYFDHFTIPFTLLQPLRQYQIEGVKWLLQNCMTQLTSGGILADEMGLGKTVQVVVALLCSSNPLPSIIVVPKSLLLNWKKEIELFIPSSIYSLFLFTPTTSTQDSIMNDLHQTIKNAKQKKQCCIILTTYSIIRNQFNRPNSIFSLHFHCCVLDEGHFIRNIFSKLHEAVCSLQSNHRIVLSGTPIQNYLDDIVGIFDFIAPHFFSSYDFFYDYYIRPIMLSYRSKQRNVLITASERIEELNGLISPFILRRTKQEVLLEIPSLTIEDIECPLTETQEALIDVYRKWNIQTNTNSSQVIQNLLAIDTHPSLITCLEELPLSQTILSSLSSYTCSGKFIVLKLLIERILQIGEYKMDCPSSKAIPKIVIFTQKPSILFLIESQLLSYKDLQYRILHSELSSSQRLAIVNEFQTNPSVCLLLTTTGIAGHGFTLTAASTVILVDHNMNPFIDMQAIDRCHRIGQTQPVVVYRLVSNETNESRIMNIQRFKEYVATTVIATDQQGQLNGGLHELSTEKLVLKHQDDIIQSLENLEKKSMKQEKYEEQINQMNNKNSQMNQTDQNNEPEEKRACLESDSSDGYEIFNFIHFFTMSLNKEKKPISERLDCLLLEILQSVQEYINKKDKYFEMYRDGMFDLTTSGLSKNCNSMDRFLDEVELTPLYNVKIENNVFTFQKCVESKKNTEQETTSTNKSNKAISDEETIRQRKEPISKDSSSEWVEKEDASEIAFEEKIEAFKKDPLYILNSMPSNNQRKAQKTLQKSFVLLCELCSMQKQIESLVNDYETLAKLE